MRIRLTVEVETTFAPNEFWQAVGEVMFNLKQQGKVVGLVRLCAATDVTPQSRKP